VRKKHVAFLDYQFHSEHGMCCLLKKQPDVIIGTETWLDPTISSYEYFPQDQYTVYSTDRPPNKQEAQYFVA
jgi:hypothetical protein